MCSTLICVGCAEVHESTGTAHRDTRGTWKLDLSYRFNVFVFKIYGKQLLNIHFSMYVKPVLNV